MNESSKVILGNITVTTKDGAIIEKISDIEMYKINYRKEIDINKQQLINNYKDIIK